MKWQVFKALHIRQRRKVIHKSWRINKVIPKIATVYCLERISRLPCREREPKQHPMDSLTWRDAARSLRRPRLSCLTHRTEFYRDWPGRCWEVMACSPWLLSMTLIDGRCTRVVCDPKLRKGPLGGYVRGLEGAVLGAYLGPVIVPFVPVRLRKKPYISSALGRAHRRVLPLLGQNLVPRLSKHCLSSASRA